MNFKLKNSKKALLALLLTTSSVINAQEYYNIPSHDGSYDQAFLSSPRAGSFELQGEFLYFKPSYDQSYYVISSTNNVVGGNVFPNGTRHNNNFNYKPAFRLEALAGFYDGQHDIDLRFTYFNGGHASSTTGPFLFDTVGFPGDGAQVPEDATYNGTARIKDHFTYYGADATLNRISFSVLPDNFTFIIGLHYAYIHHTANFNATGTSIIEGATAPVDNNLSQNSRFWGIGPQIGFDYGYTLPDWICLGNGSLMLNANIRGALLCSHLDSRFHYDTTTTGTLGVNIHNHPLWRVTPSADAKLGLSYNFICGCSHTTIELGYEMVWYNNCINSIVGNDVAFAGDTTDVFSDLSFQGPFVSLNLSF